MTGACAGQIAPCWVCRTFSERNESVNWFISLFLFLFKGHLNNRKIYQNPEASPRVLSSLVLALTVHSEKDSHSFSSVQGWQHCCWLNHWIGCSLELVVYFHQDCNFSPYLSVQKRASGIFLLLLIVPLSDGSFLVALQFMNGIASIDSNKIRYFAKIVFIVTINKTLSQSWRVQPLCEWVSRFSKSLLNVHQE